MSGCSFRAEPNTMTRNLIGTSMPKSCGIRENACPRSSESELDERSPRTALRASSMTCLISSRTRLNSSLVGEFAGIWSTATCSCIAALKQGVGNLLVYIQRDAESCGANNLSHQSGQRGQKACPHSAHQLRADRSSGQRNDRGAG